MSELIVVILFRKINFMTFSLGIFTVTFLIFGLIILYRFITTGKFYWTSYYSIQKKYNVNGIELKENILSALKKSDFKNIKTNKEVIKATTSMSMWSFSELISININQLDDTTTSVKFNSKCFLFIQIVDWGKNKSNSTLFFEKLESSF